MIARKYRSQGQFFRLPLVVVTPIAHETGTELFSVAAFQGSVRSKPLLFSFQVAVLADGRKHKAISALTALYSSSPILPPAALPALPVRGGAAGRQNLPYSCGGGRQHPPNRLIVFNDSDFFTPFA